jgi:hypothetical protein
MHRLISFHNDDYEPLAQVTWYNNKIPYCERHGYSHYFEKYVPGNDGQIQKIAMILKQLEDPEVEWVWWTGCDVLITNWNTRIEDKIDNNYHVIMSTDCNGFNADSILTRNSEESKQYWKHVLEITKTLSWHWEGEQKAIKDTYPEYSHLFKVVPQREMNAYNYAIWGGVYPSTDYLNTDGNWQQGDWVIHWPNQPLEKRLEHAAHYGPLIVK